MSLISDTDLRKILKIKENHGKWFLMLTKNLLGIEKLNKLYDGQHSHSGLDFVDYAIKTLKINYSVPGELSS
jgi:hypothetical protein